ncbi:hypothetical protein WJX73_006408 [Symbiochloris irregularis]|uniref:Uncharacterized protein n=1 Tax=Symbiochloris irregularis TaxID=706552 RepID=A0AAW1PRC6_9CHLO
MTCRDNQPVKYTSPALLLVRLSELCESYDTSAHPVPKLLVQLAYERFLPLTRWLAARHRSVECAPCILM